MTGLFLIFGFLLITVWGTWLGRRQRLIEYTSNRNRGTAVEVYCTTLSSLVGGWMFFGLNAVGFEAGLVGVAIGIGYAIGIGLLLWLAPKIKVVMTANGFDTLDEFIGFHYGRGAQTFLALTNFGIFLSVLSAQFMAMQSYLRVIAPQFAGWLPVAAALAVVIYTSIGGYKGVAVTDILKMVVLVIGVAIFASIVLSRTPEASWQQLPAKHWGLTGYGIVFMIGALVFFPPTILVRSDLWQRVVHAESPQAARKALGWTIPSLIAFYAVLTLIGMASRARLGIDTPKESAGLLLLNTDITGLPIGSAFAGIVVAVISFGIFAALASTADNNLNIAAIGLSKLLFRRDWSRVQAERQSSTPAQNTSTEATLLVKCRVLCLIVGFGSVGSALFLKDIVAVMVNAASVMLLFLPATLGALLFGHHSKHGGIFSILLGLVTYIAILALGVPLKSAFVPGFVVALLVYMTILKIEKNWRPPHAAQGGIP